MWSNSNSNSNRLLSNSNSNILLWIKPVIVIVIGKFWSNSNGNRLHFNVMDSRPVLLLYCYSIKQRHSRWGSCDNLVLTWSTKLIKEFYEY